MTELLIIGATRMTSQSLVSEVVSHGLSVVINGRSPEKLNVLENKLSGVTILKKGAFDITLNDNTKPWRKILENHLYELDFLRHAKHVNQFGVSPGINFIPGAKADHILVDDDVLPVNDQNVSETIADTMAFKVIEECKNNQYNKQRFTMSNG